jgi:glycosyltransferase involved in cell wall biosynthesis
VYDQIVPVILTLNEGPNLGRVLSKLEWARSVVVLDSHSDDETETIAKSFSNVSFYQRSFDCLANQWNAGIEFARQTGNWVLALDADYLLSDELVEEFGGLRPDGDVAGYEARFIYCIDGMPLRASLYPPHTVLFRAELGEYVQDGHAQRLVLNDPIQRLVHPIFHDDRKSRERWYVSQRHYARQEAEKIRNSSWSALPFSGKIRRIPLLSIALAPVYLLLSKGLWRDGIRGWKYVWQRLVAEWLIQKSLWAKARG